MQQACATLDEGDCSVHTTYKMLVIDCSACATSTSYQRDRMLSPRSCLHTHPRAIVSTVAPHFGEEASLQGWRGSGTVFFSMWGLLLALANILYGATTALCSDESTLHVHT